MDEAAETKAEIGISWRGGNKTYLVPVGEDGAVMRITEYWDRIDGKRVPVAMTMAIGKRRGR